MPRRNRYQFGSLELRKRTKGADVWIFRYWDRQNPSATRPSITLGTVKDYPTQADARRAAEGLRLEINHGLPLREAITFQGLIDRYVNEEIERGDLAHTTMEPDLNRINKQQKIIDYLREENRVLRAQIGTRRLRFDDDERRRLAVRANALGMRLLSELATIVTPETLLRWHRRLVAEKYDGSARAALGRPRTTSELAALVVRMATENRDWGCRRIQGALWNLGHTVARGTIANILKKHGIDPAPERSRADDMEGLLDSALGADGGG